MPPSALELSEKHLEEVERGYLLTRSLRAQEARTGRDALELSRESIRLAKRTLLAVQKARRSPHTLRVHARSHASRLALEKHWEAMLRGLMSDLSARYDIEAAWHAAKWTMPPPEPEDGQLAGHVNPWRAAIKRLYKPTPGDEQDIQGWGPGRADLAQQALDAGGLILRGPHGEPVAVIDFTEVDGAIHVTALATAPGGDYGRQALHEVAQQAARKGLALTVDAQTPAQQSFYSKLGGVPLQAAVAGVAGLPPKPTGSQRLIMDAQVVAQFAQYEGFGPPSADAVRAALASGVNEASWMAGAHSRYIGLATDTAEEAGQVSLDHLGLHETFEFAHPENMGTDLFAQRGSKVIQNLYGDHQASLADIITQATDPRAPLTIQETTARIQAEWPDLERYQAERIARTETAAVWTTMAANAYAANGIAQFETIVASGPSIGIDSEDPCDECVDAAEDVHSIEDDLPPWHPNCRCEAVPVLEDPETGDPWLPPDEPWTGQDYTVREGALGPGALVPAPLPGEPMGGRVTADIMQPTAEERTAFRNDIAGWPDFSGNTSQQAVKDLGLSIVDSGGDVMVAQDASGRVIGVGMSRAGDGQLLVQQTATSGISDWGLFQRYAERAAANGDALAFDTSNISAQAQRRLEAAGATRDGETLVLAPEDVPGAFDVPVPRGPSPAYMQPRPALPPPLPPEYVAKIQALGLDKWPPAMGDAAQQMFKGLGEGADTRSLYLKDGEWTAERAQLHDDIISAHFDGKVKATGQPVAMFTSGGGASGKSGSEFFFDGKLRTLKELEARDDIVVIDPDAIKKMMPEYKALQASKDTYAAAAVHEESSDLSKVVADLARKNGYNVIFDTTASSDTFVSKIAKFKDAGYETQVTMTSIPTNEAVVRSIERAEKPGGASEGRFVNAVSLKRAHIGASKQLRVWKDAPVVDRWRVYDNSGDAPVVVAEGGGGVTHAVHDPQTFDTIMAKANEPPGFDGLAPASTGPADPIVKPTPESPYSGLGAEQTEYMAPSDLGPTTALDRMKTNLIAQDELVRTQAFPVALNADTYRPTGPVWAFWHGKTAVVLETRAPGLTLSYAEAQATRDSVIKLLDSIPDGMRAAERLRYITVMQGVSPQEAAMVEKLGAGEVLAQASTAKGQMWFWQQLPDQGTFDHELGHIIGLASGAPDTFSWGVAMRKDIETSGAFNLMEMGVGSPILVGNPGVTLYADDVLRATDRSYEDWAESIRLWLLDRREGGRLIRVIPRGKDMEDIRFASFKDLFPERAKLIERWVFALEDPAATKLRTQIQAMRDRIERDRSNPSAQAQENVKRLTEQLAVAENQLRELLGSPEPAPVVKAVTLPDWGPLLRRARAG